MKRIIILLALATVTPGCIAAMVGGIAYMSGKSTEKRAAIEAKRLEYLSSRRAAGATDEQIISEIKATDPVWYAEIQKKGLDPKEPPK